MWGAPSSRRAGRISAITSFALFALVTCTTGDGSVADPGRAEPAIELEAEPAQTGARESAKAGPLCLHLEPSRRRALLGEPVLLIVGLENCSDRPLEVPSLLAAEYGFLTVLARPPGSEREIAYHPTAPTAAARAT